MKTEEKNSLLNIAYRFCDALKINYIKDYNFDSKHSLFENIREIDDDAFNVLNTYFNAVESNARDKSQENPTSANFQEHFQQTEEVKETLKNAGKELLTYADDKNIDLNGIFAL